MTSITYSINKYGWLQPIVYNPDLSKVIDGMTRLEIALSGKLGPSIEVPVLAVRAGLSHSVEMRLFLNTQTRFGTPGFLRGAGAWLLANGVSRDEVIESLTMAAGCHPETIEILMASDKLPDINPGEYSDAKTQS